MLREGFELLKKYGINVPRYWVNEFDESKIKFPVVVKADLLHKTEYGAVKVGVKNIDELREVINEFKKKFGNKDIIIQEQIEKPFLEFIASVERDPTFDYFIMFGIGGIYTELFKDFIILLPPFDFGDFSRLIKELKLYKILEGYRTGIKVNLEEIYNVLKKLEEIILRESSIAELEINPLIYKDKCYAVDVRFSKVE